MNSRLALLVLIWVVVSSQALAVKGIRPALPNIILMIADDMGIGATDVYLGVRMGAKSRPIAVTQSTPQLKAFSQDAVVFNNAYAPSPMDSSTRHSIGKGRFARRSYLKTQAWLPHHQNAPMIQLTKGAWYANECQHCSKRCILFGTS